MRISEFIEGTNDARTPSELTSVFKQAIAARGYEHFVYGMLTNHRQYEFKDNISPPVLAIDYPGEWIKHYFENGYLAIDPIVSRTPVMRRPFLWDELTNLTDRQNTFMSEAKDAGLDRGICVPIHGPFGESFSINFVTSNRDVDPARTLRELQMLATSYHTAYFEMVVQSPDRPPEPTQLTQRERECLVWSARGKSSWDIGMILGISEDTVNFHIKNSMAKLDAGNRIMAIVKAIRMGLILP